MPLSPFGSQLSLGFPARKRFFCRAIFRSLPKALHCPISLKSGWMVCRCDRVFRAIDKDSVKILWMSKIAEMPIDLGYAVDIVTLAVLSHAGICTN